MLDRGASQFKSSNVRVSLKYLSSSVPHTERVRDKVMGGREMGRGREARYHTEDPFG